MENRWHRGHWKLSRNRPSTVTWTSAKTKEHGITASSPKHANKTLTNVNATPTPRQCQANYWAQGCALTAPGRLRQLTFSFGRLKKSSWSPGRALLLLVECSVKRAEKFNILALACWVGVYWTLQKMFNECCTEETGVRRCSKVVLHDFTCNIIHHFEWDKRHDFRFVPLLKIVLKFFVWDRMVR